MRKQNAHLRKINTARNEKRNCMNHHRQAKLVFQHTATSALTSDVELNRSLINFFTRSCSIKYVQICIIFTYCKIPNIHNNTQLPYSTKSCYQQKDLQNKLHQPERANGESVRMCDV
ncbi:Hypothetical_protein [Hexamita inflata]|uniref:Hypothetical_protein n=1 Tax=Hexamita inflata TaxID=28002 RepID=A0ABP1H2M8_9EUKA